MTRRRAEFLRRTLAAETRRRKQDTAFDRAALAAARWGLMAVAVLLFVAVALIFDRAPPGLDRFARRLGVQLASVHWIEAAIVLGALAFVGVVAWREWRKLRKD
ncbi:MAG: hypothetical protein ACFB2Z_00540 [Maricaulaceae bacterium]